MRSTEGVETDAKSIETMNLHFAQLLDSALPVGAFSHSFGLETFLSNGEISNIARLHEFCVAALHGNWAPCDAMLIKAAFTLETREVWRLDCLMDAARVSRETREGQRKIGRQGLKLGAQILPDARWQPLQIAAKNGDCAPSWPLVFGWWARLCGQNQSGAATGYLFACCNAALGAGVRWGICGQTQAQRALGALAGECEAAWAGVENQNPFDFWSATPLLERAQIEHENLEARLFMS